MFGGVAQAFTRPRRRAQPLKRVNTTALRTTVNRFRLRSRLFAEELVAGRITVGGWAGGMLVEIERLHTMAYMVGKGGPDALDAGDPLVIARIVERQRGYLTRWAEQLAAGIRQGNPPTVQALMNRAELYLTAANATMHEAQTEALGIPSPPAQPGDGTTSCLTNCRCRWRVVQRGETSWDLYWTLSSAEHCPECERRSQVWNPLRIVNGVIEPYDRTRLFR